MLRLSADSLSIMEILALLSANNIKNNSRSSLVKFSLNMNDKPEYWIEKLGMKAHPEGGYFSEIYRSKDLITGLPARFQGTRCCSTSIYFLLKNDQFSAFHRIKSDEIWHYYTGTSSIELFVFNNLGNLEIHKLGQDIAAGEVFQVVIPACNWFAARPKQRVGFALIGCTV